MSSSSQQCLDSEEIDIANALDIVVKLQEICDTANPEMQLSNELLISYYARLRANLHRLISVDTATKSENTSARAKAESLRNSVDSSLGSLQSVLYEQSHYEKEAAFQRAQCDTSTLEQDAELIPLEEFCSIANITELPQDDNSKHLITLQRLRYESDCRKQLQRQVEEATAVRDNLKQRVGIAKSTLSSLSGKHEVLVSAINQVKAHFTSHSKKSRVSSQNNDHLVNPSMVTALPSHLSDLSGPLYTLASGFLTLQRTVWPNLDVKVIDQPHPVAHPYRVLVRLEGVDTLEFAYIPSMSIITTSTASLTSLTRIYPLRSRETVSVVGACGVQDTTDDCGEVCLWVQALAGLHCVGTEQFVLANDTESVLASDIASSKTGVSHSRVRISYVDALRRVTVRVLAAQQVTHSIAQLQQHKSVSSLCSIRSNMTPQAVLAKAHLPSLPSLLHAVNTVMTAVRDEFSCDGVSVASIHRDNQSHTDEYTILLTHNQRTLSVVVSLDASYPVTLPRVSLRWCVMQPNGTVTPTLSPSLAVAQTSVLESIPVMTSSCRSALVCSGWLDLIMWVLRYCAQKMPEWC